jgi:hypothetical protein
MAKKCPLKTMIEYNEIEIRTGYFPDISLISHRYTSLLYAGHASMVNNNGDYTQDKPQNHSVCGQCPSSGILPQMRSIGL